MTEQAQQLDTILASARKVARDVSSLREAVRPEGQRIDPVHVPGWDVIELSATQLSEVRKFVQINSRPEEPQARFICPSDADVNIICTRGSVAIFNLDDTEPVVVLTSEPHNNFHFAQRGSKRSVQAQVHPTQVLCVAWREAQSNEQRDTSELV